MNTVLEALTCSVCLERLKDPRQLSCGHCFCLSCLEELSSPRCCPECRTELLEKPEDLAPDYKLQQLIELLNKENKHSCFYCEIKVDESINVCSHCQKRFCETCLSQHWRAMIIKKSEVLQESLRGFETPEEFREHCQSVVLEGMRTAQKECHSLIDRLFSKNPEAIRKRYDKINVLLPEVQLLTESGSSAKRNYSVISPEVYESTGTKLTECHETLEIMYEDVTAVLQNIKSCVRCLHFALRWMLPGPRICNPNDWLKNHEVRVDEIVGTRKVDLDAPSGKDYETCRGKEYELNTRHQCISAMERYRDYSLEELRWGDYRTERPLKAAVYHATAILTAAGPGKRYAGLINAFEKILWKMPEEKAVDYFLFGYEPDTLGNENMPSHTISTSDLLQYETSASEDSHTPVDAITTEKNTDIVTNIDEGGEDSCASESDDVGQSVSVKCDLGEAEAPDDEHLGLATPFEQVVEDDFFQESFEGKNVDDEVVGESE